MNIFEQSTSFQLKGFPRISDQGERGTCAAFSMAAMLEYHLDFKEKLSPQHIYACCHLDSDIEGSEIESVFQNVKRFGVCRYAAWPYNKNSAGNQSQISDPAVLKNIPVIRFDDVDFQIFKTNPPRGIDEYKSVLSGADGRKPSPVIVGCEIFKSTFNTPGWVTLPLDPLEAGEGGHAMLIYGWKDTPGMESAGYFLAQNSWADNYLVKIPFEYIENHALKAGYLSAEAKHAEEGYNIEKEEIKVNSNIEQKNIEQKGKTLPPEVMAVKKDFFSSQGNNMKSGKYSFPGIRLPFPQNLGAFWNVDTSNFDEPQNIKEPNGFSDFLKKNGTDHLFGEVKIYRIQIKGKYYYHLVSAFLYRYDGKQVDMNDIDLLMQYYENYLKRCRSKAPRYKFYTVGTYGMFAEHCQTSCDPALFLCELTEEKVWLFRLPKAECGWITQEFFAHILPGNLVSVIREKLENWSKSQRIDLNAIKEKLGVNELHGLYDSHIESALDVIFQNGGYARNKKGYIVPVSWTVPSGYKIQNRYTPPTKRQYTELFLWCSVSLALGLLQCYLTSQIKIPLRYQVISLLFLLLWTIIRYNRGKALQSFKFGVVN